VEAGLSAFLPAQPTAPYSPVVEAMRYSLFAGGKRVRPILCLAAAEAVLGDPKEASLRAMPFACALECIHTYSLIHDDLPAMDNDDLRRGRPTSHKVYGEALAILAGDGLLTLAFHLATDLSFYPGLAPERLLDATREMSDAAGFRGMIGGQVVDIEAAGKAGTIAGLERLHRLKTGALIRASVRCGALLAGAAPERLAALSAYADNVGLVFQVADDILDVVGEAEQMGKNVGGDARKQKLTYPGLIGLEEARRQAGRLLDAAVDSLRSFGPAARPLREIAAYVVQRTN
ncbi:MAG: farnesyl diphosphate synthase, partial [Pseudomonadota bacterium]